MSVLSRVTGISNSKTVMGHIHNLMTHFTTHPELNRSIRFATTVAKVTYFPLSPNNARKKNENEPRNFSKFPTLASPHPFEPQKLKRWSQTPSKPPPYNLQHPLIDSRSLWTVKTSSFMSEASNSSKEEKGGGCGLPQTDKNKEAPPSPLLLSSPHPSVGSLHSEQGKREEMEDYHIVSKLLPEISDDFWFYAVLDGHGGKHSAREVSEEFPSILSKHLRKEMELSSLDGSNSMYKKETIRFTLWSAVLEMDRQLFDKMSHSFSGTTMIGAFVTPNDIYLVNVGHSRGLLYFSSFLEYVLSGYDTFEGTGVTINFVYNLHRPCFGQLAASLFCAAPRCN